MKRNTVIELIAALFILLFVYTALSKLWEPGRFQWALSKSPLLSAFAGLLVYAIPLLELIASALLFFPRTRLAGMVAAFGLMSLFTVYIGYMLLFAAKLPCSCGGIIQQLTWQQHVLVNIFFTCLAALGILLMVKPRSVFHSRRSSAF